MAASRTVPSDHPAFTELPVRRIAVGPAGEHIAVHVAGPPLVDRLPVVCVPGYHRNMSDFTEFAGLIARISGGRVPVVLIDLKGRGRSSDRRDGERYVSNIDARDVLEVCRALALTAAVFVGQGFGGQVLMALAAQRPSLMAGTVLIDAGPVSDPRGLVRLRNNLSHVEATRTEAAQRGVFHRMLAADYPGVPDSLLDRLALRTHYTDRRGRVRPLFDPELRRGLDAFEHDDVLTAQWQLFGALWPMPLLMMRTQLTAQLRREVFDEMMRRRPEAGSYVIEGQGSPALLSRSQDVGPILEFVRAVEGQRGGTIARRVAIS